MYLRKDIYMENSGFVKVRPSWKKVKIVKVKKVIRRIATKPYEYLEAEIEGIETVEELDNYAEQLKNIMFNNRI